MEAIIYTSNSGFTEQYARLLSKATGLKCCSLKESGNIEKNSDIIYLGWLMAGKVKGLKKAARKYNIKTVCAVGMGENGGQTEDIHSHNAISCPLFMLQGGFDLSRLHGVYKFMMSAMSKGVAQKLSQKENKTPQELDMLDLMANGGSRVSLDNLTPVLRWWNKQ